MHVPHKILWDFSFSPPKERAPQSFQYGTSIGAFYFILTLWSIQSMGLNWSNRESCRQCVHTWLVRALAAGEVFEMSSNLGSGRRQPLTNNILLEETSFASGTRLDSRKTTLRNILSILRSRQFTYSSRVNVTMNRVMVSPLSSIVQTAGRLPAPGILRENLATEAGRNKLEPLPGYERQRMMWDPYSIIGETCTSVVESRS